MYRGLPPHKPFGLEPLGIELEAEMLRAERFTPPDEIGIFDMPAVHMSVHLTGVSLRFTPAGDFTVGPK